MEQKTRVLCISASPRKEGSRSEELLKKLIKRVWQYGGLVEEIRLAERKIQPCQGCYSEKPKKCTFPCIHEDDTNEILKAIIRADALAVSTPIYWGGPSSLLRILIEKMTALENNCDKIVINEHKEPLEGKPFVIVSSQDCEGASLALSQTAWAFCQLGLMLLPYGLIFEPILLKRPIVRFGLRLINERKFEWIENTIRLAARSLVLLPQELKSYTYDDYLVREPKN